MNLGMLTAPPSLLSALNAAWPANTAAAVGTLAGEASLASSRSRALASSSAGSFVLLGCLIRRLTELEQMGVSLSLQAEELDHLRVGLGMSAREWPDSVGQVGDLCRTTQIINLPKVRTGREFVS